MGSLVNLMFTRLFYIFDISKIPLGSRGSQQVATKFYSFKLEKKKILNNNLSINRKINSITNKINWKSMI